MKDEEMHSPAALPGRVESTFDARLADLLRYRGLRRRFGTLIKEGIAVESGSHSPARRHIRTNRGSSLRPQNGRSMSRR
jgi:hypothetical protein